MMKLLAMLIIAVALAASCGRAAREASECTPAEWPRGVSEKSLLWLMQRATSVRLGDTTVDVWLTPPVIESVRILAWYTVADIQNPGDTLDYAFAWMRYRSKPFFFENVVDARAFERLRDSLALPDSTLEGLLYLVRWNRRKVSGLHAGTFHVIVNEHARAFVGHPVAADAYRLLRIWSEPYALPPDDDSPATGFEHPRDGDTVELSYWTYARPEDRRPGLVIDSEVCEAAWLDLFGVRPTVRPMVK